MDIKKKIITILLLFVSLISMATGQEGDILVIDGETWSLLCRPICYDSVFYHRLKAILPKERDIKSSNWDGFQVTWSIKDNMLMLDSVLVDMYDEETKNSYVMTMTRRELENVFADSEMSFVATWLTDTIRAVQGKCVRYVHMGFERNHERELHLFVEKGRIIGRQLYENKVLVDGFWFRDLKQTDIQARISISTDHYPDFIDHRIIFSIRNMQADEKGNLIDCEVQAIVGDVLSDDKRMMQLANDFKTAMKAIHPWRVQRINGKIIVGDGQNWIIPYKLTE